MTNTKTMHATGILRWVKQKLGFGRLGGSFGRFLVVIVAFTLGMSLSGSFFNVFVLRATGSDFALMNYNLLMACVQPFVMLPAVVLLRKRSAGACLRLGLALHGLGYLILASGINGGPVLVYGLSTLYGAGNAFYYTSYTPHLLSTTDDENRDSSQSAMNAIAIAFNLLLPLVTGFFLTHMGDLAAYRVVFFLSSIVTFGGFAFSFRLYPVKGNGDRNTYLWDSFKRIVKSPNMRISMTVNTLNSFRVAAATYYLSLLMYDILEQEAVMGVVSTVCSILGILASLLYAKIMTPRRRGISIICGSALMLLGILFLEINTNVIGFVVLSIVNTVTTYFIDTPVAMAYMSALQHDPVLSSRPAEVQALREFWWAIGRAGGLIPVFFVANIGDYAGPIMIFITMLQLPAGWLAHILQKRIARQNGQLQQ